MKAKKLPVKTVFRTLSVLGFIGQLLAQGKPVSPFIMGQNYHYAHWNSPATNSLAPLHATNVWPKVTEAGTKLVRIGGKQYNINNERPKLGQEVYYVSIIDDIRKNGCEPVLTLPFLLTTSNTPQPNVGMADYTLAVATSTALAQNILHLINTVHKRNVKYIVLGNEPDIDYGWEVGATCSPTSNCPPDGTLTAQQVAANIAGYIKPMADAIRSMPGGSAIKIIGPEYTHCLPKVYNELFTPSISATYIGGNSPSGLPYLDYISFHAYGPSYNGFSYTSTTSYSPTYGDWDPEVSYCNLERYYKMDTESPNSARRYRGALRYMHELIARCTGRSQPLGFMVTEMNSGHDNKFDPTPSTAALAASGVDAISMQGAQNLARMYALAMEYGAASVMMWGVQESGPYIDRGYLVGQGSSSPPKSSRRPSWFHYKMLADYFKGTFYRDEEFANYTTSSGSLDQISDETATNEPNPRWLHYNNTTSQTATIGGTPFALSSASDFTTHLKVLCETKAFAAAAGANIAVMVLNHSGSQQDVAIRFSNNNTFSNSGATKKFRFNIQSAYHNESYFDQTSGTNSVVAANATDVFIFSCSGSLLQRYTYTEIDHASTYDKTFSLTANNGTPNTFTSTVSTPTLNCLPNTSCNITASGGFTNYAWYNPPGLSAVGTGSVYSNASPGLYQVVATGTASGCGTVATSAVVHQNSPLVEAGKSLTFCPGVSTSGVLGSTLLATSNYGGYTYTWQPGGTQNATVVVNNTLVTSSKYYTLTASAGSCTFTDKVFIQVEDDVQLLIKDDHHDVGLIPTPSAPPWGNALSYPPWISPDIYANYINGTTLGDAFIQPSTTSYVKVRVHNRGCLPLQSAASVSLYFTVAGVGNNWSTAWVNYPCSSFYPSNYCAITSSILCGDFIGSVSTPTIPAGGSAVVVFTWTVPPDYNCLYAGPKAGFKNFHFNNWTLKAIVDHAQDGKAMPTGNAYYNITHDNNVAAKKVVRYVPQPYNPNNGPSGIYIFNNQSSGSVRLDFVPRNDYNSETVLNYGNAIMYFPNEFLQQWIDNGEQGEGVVLLSDTSVQIVSENAYMDDFPLLQYHAMPAGLMVFPTHPVDLSGGESFDLDVILRPTGDADSIIGGITYQIMKEEWDCGDCGGSALRQSFTATHFEDDSLHILSNFTVTSGQTKSYERCILRFAQNTIITVEQGGKLIMENCLLEAACKDQSWNGIEILGAANGFTAESCNFRNTATPIIAENAVGLVILRNAFIGTNQNAGAAVRLNHCGNFDISYNHIAGFSEGVYTSLTYTTQAANTIERNVVQSTKIGVRSFRDDHRNTSIACNTFRYRQYGIYADSTEFADFGSSSQPAGNRFKGKSQMSSHKVNHNSGNSPSYYYSSSLPDSTGMNIATALSANEKICYPGDSASSSSMRVTGVTAHRSVDFGLKAIPNPGSNDMLIVMSLGDSHNGRLLIRDAQGRLIEQFEIDRTQPELNLDWTGRARGIYFATLELPTGQVAHVKLLVQD